MKSTKADSKRFAAQSKTIDSELLQMFVRKFCFGWIDKLYLLMYNSHYT